MVDIIPHDIAVQDNIMCCCRKSLSHDETMKFKLKVSKEYEGVKSLLDCTLFNQRQEGELIKLEEEQTNKLKIPTLIEKHMIFGRHIEIHEAIKFLTRPGDQRILNINGIFGVGCSTIARYAIKYVCSRHFFEEGAFYVDCNNKFSTQSLLAAISKTLNLITTEKQEIVDIL